jgi:hypothetical protein
VKLEMRDLPAALQLAEGVTPQLSTSGSARLRGEALMVQADVLLALAAKHRRDEASHQRLLKEISLVLESAAAQFEAVAELNPLRRCQYLLSRTYHQLGNVPRRNACASRFRQISEFFDSSAHGQRGSWTALGLTPERRSAHSTLEDSLATHIELPSSKTSFMPSTPPSWGASSSQKGGVSARPASALGASSIAGSHIMGTGFGEVSPFTYAVDAAAAAAAAAAAMARVGQAGDCKDQDAMDQLNERCPALAQLLAVAEAEDGAVAGSNASCPPGSLLKATLGASPRPEYSPFGAKRSGGVQTVIGTIHALYPMAAVLSS